MSVIINTENVYSCLHNDYELPLYINNVRYSSVNKYIHDNVYKHDMYTKKNLVYLLQNSGTIPTSYEKLYREHLYTAYDNMFKYNPEVKQLFTSSKVNFTLNTTNTNIIMNSDSDLMKKVLPDVLNELHNKYTSMDIAIDLDEDFIKVIIHKLLFTEILSQNIIPRDTSLEYLFEFKYSIPFTQKSYDEQFPIQLRYYIFNMFKNGSKRLQTPESERMSVSRKRKVIIDDLLYKEYTNIESDWLNKTLYTYICKRALLHTYIELMDLDITKLKLSLLQERLSTQDIGVINSLSIDNANMQSDKLLNVLSDKVWHVCYDYLSTTDTYSDILKLYTNYVDINKYNEGDIDIWNVVDNITLDECDTWYKNAFTVNKYTNSVVINDVYYFLYFNFNSMFYVNGIAYTSVEDYLITSLRYYKELNHMVLDMHVSEDMFETPSLYNFTNKQYRQFIIKNTNLINTHEIEKRIFSKLKFSLDTLGRHIYSYHMKTIMNTKCIQYSIRYALNYLKDKKFVYVDSDLSESSTVIISEIIRKYINDSITLVMEENLEFESPEIIVQLNKLEKDVTNSYTSFTTSIGIDPKNVENVKYFMKHLYNYNVDMIPYNYKYYLNYPSTQVSTVINSYCVNIFNEKIFTGIIRADNGGELSNAAINRRLNTYIQDLCKKYYSNKLVPHSLVDISAVLNTLYITMIREYETVQIKDIIACFTNTGNMEDIMKDNPLYRYNTMLNLD